MKLTKKLEAEILKIYYAYWDAYCKGDIKIFASFLDDNITIYGSASGEVFSTKKDALRFYKATAKEVTGKLEFRKRRIKLKTAGSTAIVNEECAIYVLAGKIWMFYGHGRITAVLEQKHNGWKIIQLHASFPDVRTEEGEQIAAEKIKKENLRLKEAVQRLTEELEEKNKELQIESALERVRTVAMGMKKAEDMLSICKTISQQLQKLGVKEIRNVQTAIIHMHKGTYLNYEYYAKHNKLVTTEVSYINHPMSKAFVKKMLDGPNEFFKRSLSAKKTRQWYAFQKTTNQFTDKYLLKASSLNYFWYSLGPVALGISTYAPLNKEEQELFVRFRNVFELSYRRFLDIEKANAQAREAQIEAALERVRSRSLAMHKSDELKEVIRMVLEQLIHLKINVGHAGFYIDYKVHDDMHIWLADPNIEPFFAVIPYFDTPTWNSFLKAKANKTTFHTDWLDFKEKNKFYNALFKLFTIPEEAKAFYLQCRGLAVSTALLDSVGLYMENFDGIPYTDDENKILMRFGKVFQQAYTRFLDLQKAEAQAREAQVQLALERVRARTMAMQKSDELPETSHILFEQMKELGEPVEQLTIGIVNEENNVIEISATLLGDTLKKIYRHSIDEPYMMNKVYKAWKKQQKTLVVELRGDELNAYNKYRNELTNSEMFPTNLGEEHRRIVYAAFFSKGLLALGANEPRPPESLQLLVKFASMFDLTYTRFLDLQKAEAQTLRAEQDLIKIKAARKKAEKALTELQVTQKQLIQSEKMASLGELTAGIAHEIQNPLNFVNNFSEVSNELLDEMKAELATGNWQLANEIADNVKQNLEKINHHGKRAADIVKGMLQHSRTSSGQKELTDINALCDEYLRLAYHGLRAKDKSFNAKFETAFDETLTKINIVPQDMGRVILNLINNAFYAVQQKQKELTERKSSFENLTSLYQPTVTVSTKKSGDNILISVKDNGNGIPDSIKEKIFQPFFTTKPTGQGTGLGLSLSYDIVKVHGGELKVETKEGEGSEFIVSFDIII